jgi:hypothetical protein
MIDLLPELSFGDNLQPSQVTPRLREQLADRERRKPTATNIRLAFLVPFFCQIYVLYFAARGYRPALLLNQAGLHTVPVEN